MDGWIKLHRSILKSFVWQQSTPTQKTVLVTLAAMAAWDSRKWEWNGKVITLNAGQMVSSLEKIAENAGEGVTPKMIRCSLEHFERLGVIEQETSSRGRLITIKGWNDYQNAGDGGINKEKTEGKPRASKNSLKNQGKSFPKNENRHTKGKPRADQWQAYKKEYKEYKEQENVREGETGCRFTPPTTQEVREYCKQMGFIDFDAEWFVDYYSQKHWKSGQTQITDWKMYVRKWYRQDQKRTTTKKGKFLQFPQHNYNMDKLEEQLLKRHQ